MARNKASFDQFIDEAWAKLCTALALTLDQTQELVGRYERILSIQYGCHFIQRCPWLRSWTEPKNGHGKSKRLHECHLVQMLLGAYAVAVPRNQCIDFFVIDLDCKTKAATAGFDAVFAKVVGVLGQPSILLQSSSSGGYHLCYFLAERLDHEELFELVRNTLEEKGIHLNSGRVELFPHGNLKLRLPCGPGSKVLDPRTRKPLFEDGELRQEIEKFLELAEAGRQPLTAYIGKIEPRSVTTTPILAKSKSKKKARPGKHSNPFLERIERIKTGITAYGQRYKESKAFIWYLVRYLELDADQALSEYEKWLKEGKHRSRDLKRDRDGTIRGMLLDGQKKIAHLINTRKAGAGRRRKEKAGSQCPRGRILLQYVAHRAEAEGAAGREYLLGLVTPDDRTLVGSLLTKNPARRAWLTKRLPTLIGLLRFVMAEFGGKHIALDSEILRFITGGRPAPGAVRFETRSGRVLVVNGHSTRALREAAERLGLIRLQLPAIAGVRPNVYEISIPAAAVASGSAA